jgi:hypothetical protein
MVTMHCDHLKYLVSSEIEDLMAWYVLREAHAVKHILIGASNDQPSRAFVSKTTGSKFGG